MTMINYEKLDKDCMYPLHIYCYSFMFTLVKQWSENSLFLGVMLGITSFGVESTPKLQWNPLQSSDLNHSFESRFHYFEHFERGFPLQNEVIPNMTPKRVDFQYAHLENDEVVAYSFNSKIYLGYRQCCHGNIRIASLRVCICRLISPNLQWHLTSHLSCYRSPPSSPPLLFLQWTSLIYSFPRAWPLLAYNPDKTGGEKKNPDMDFVNLNILSMACTVLSMVNVDYYLYHQYHLQSKRGGLV